MPRADRSSVRLLFPPRPGVIPGSQAAREERASVPCRSGVRRPTPDPPLSPCQEEGTCDGLELVFQKHKCSSP